MQTLATRVVRCPSCQAESEVGKLNLFAITPNRVWLVLICSIQELMQRSNRDGYLQDGFIARCRNTKCTDKKITKARLAHRKMAWDIAAMPITQDTACLA